MDKLQAYERKGKIGILFYGEDDSEESSWTEHTVIYCNHKSQRTRNEIMKENARMLCLGVYDNCPKDCSCSTCNGIDDMPEELN